MKPKVSIIIPVYNTEKYLAKCLQSLVEQTLRDIEIICINDGSTDDCAKILSKFAEQDSRIKVLNQENMGQSCARNAGIRIAKGDYIGFIDSDDYAKNEMFEKLLTNIEQFSSDFSMCSVEVFNEKNKKTTCHDPYLSLDIFNKIHEDNAFTHKDCSDFLFRICVTPWNKLFRKEFLLTNNIFFEENINFEDNVFTLKALLYAKKMSIIKEALVVYRKESETSYTFGKDDYKKLDFFKITELEENILRETDTFNLYRKYFQFHRRTILEYWYTKIKNPFVKIIYLFKLIRTNPFFLVYKVKKHIWRLNTKLELKKICKSKKIIVCDSSDFVQKLTKNLDSPNFIGYLDLYDNHKNPQTTSHPVYSLEDIKHLSIDLVVIISQNYYKYENIVKSKLNENNVNVQIKRF